MAWKSAPFLATPEQSRIEQSEAPRLLIEANAGVGKTTTLCRLALRRVQQGADPSRLLMLSYTQAGSEALQRTLEKQGASATLRGQLRVGTFDDFCAARLARLEDADVQRYVRPEEVRPFVVAAIARAREVSEARFPDAFVLSGTGELAVESLLKDFERIKGTMVLQRQDERFTVTPDSAEDTGFGYTTLAIFLAYEAIRRIDAEQVRFRYLGDPTYDLACVLTADDPVFDHHSHPLKLAALQAVFVDEFHDMNRAMATVLQGLMAMQPDACFAGVGDVDQVIHADSGADAYFLRQGFEIEFGPVARMALTQTQRFGRAIAEPLGRFAAKPYPCHPARDSRMAALALPDALALALHLQAVLQARRADNAKAPHSEVAVLLRHPNAALDLEYELPNRGVYYEARGFTAYMSRPEVLFVRMVLAVAIGCAEAFTEASFAQAKLASWAFIGGDLPLGDGAADPQTAAKIQRAPFDAFRQGMIKHLLERTPRRQGARCVQAAIDLARDGRIDSLGPALAALKLGDLARHVFVNAEAVSDAADSLRGLGRMVRRNQFNELDELLRGIRRQEEQSQAWGSKERIVLSTIERAKGLEFDHVLIPGLNRGEFDGEGGDERNLFYVAVSRARQAVELVHRPGAASRFVPAALLAAAGAP